MIAIEAIRDRTSIQSCFRSFPCSLRRLREVRQTNKRGALLAPRLDRHVPFAHAFLHRARRRIVVDRRPQNDAGMSVPADKPFLCLLGKSDSRCPRVAFDLARVESRGLGLTNIHKLVSPRCRPSISQPNPCMFVRPDPRSPRALGIADSRRPGSPLISIVSKAQY